jgi:hypothetical protein
MLTKLQGNSDSYCGTGCQTNFGTCSSTTGGNVPGLGYFANFKTYNFESGIFPTDLHKSGYPVPDTVGNPQAIYNHSFTPDNVVLENGYMVLKVPGGQNTSPILCAEVQTVATNIQYASVRTTAILTQEPGVVDGKLTPLTKYIVTQAYQRQGSSSTTTTAKK